MKLTYFLHSRYQNELPERIKQRGKDAHMLHEELVQAMKWKQSVSLDIISKLNFRRLISFFFILKIARQILQTIIKFDQN